MGKYKLAKKKSDTPAVPQMKPGLPCLVIVIGVIIFVTLVMVMVMRSA
jgi:hypothetical protein